jgi:flavin-dependent dehydrogenase
MPAVEGADALYSPRRTLLDNVLVRAGVAAGAEVRQKFIVEHVLFDGDRVVGIAGKEKGGAPVTERGALVIGADPITGQGMADALRDAELVSDAVAAGLDGTMPLDRALATYEKRRDASLKPMFDMTVRLAALRPAGRFERALFEALAARPADADRFFAITTGAAAQSTLFNPVSLTRLFGARGLAGLMVGRQAPSHPRPA